MSLVRAVRHRALFGLLLVLAAGLFWYSRTKPNTNLNSPSAQQPPSLSAESGLSLEEAVKEIPEGWEMVGGIARPKFDVVAYLTPAADDDPPPQKREGAAPEPVRTETEQVKQVHDALYDDERPERRSSLVVPTDFDNERFKTDSVYADKYVNTVEPGRVFASAQPSEEVKAIGSNGTRYHRVLQGQAVRLQVVVPPNSPVTFTSFRFGQFSNKLTSITVPADESGIASADFTATSGTLDRVNVMAASPMTSGQVDFAIDVRLE
jgi:hypothetical protein